MRSLNLICLLLGLITFWSCKKREQKNKASAVDTSQITYWLPKAVLYEVNVRQHTPQGTLNAFSEDLDRLKDLGVNVLWIMPVQPIGMTKRKAKGDLFAEDIKDSAGRARYLGSPYSIKDYTDVNPDLGTLTDFKKMVEKAHALGFKVILDWVGNHTSWDNAMISEHPEWYTKNKKGEITDPLDEKGNSIGWTDVADLNYDNKELRKYMIDAMKFWLDSCQLDGFRCDVAMNVPADFWEEAKTELSKVKPVFMLAESEEHDMKQFDKAFNAYYAWEMHHVLNEIAKGNKNALYLDTVLQKKYSKFPKNVFAMNFITNHDENSWNGTEFDRMGDAWKAMAVVAFTIPGLPLMYTGQELGLKKKLKFFEKDTVVPSGDADYFRFYKDLLALRKANKAFDCTPQNNQLTCIPGGNTDLFMFKRESGNNELIIAVNLSVKPVKINPALPENMKYLLAESFDKAKGELGAWGFVIVSK